MVATAAHLAAYLPDVHLGQALAIAVTIPEERPRAGALTALAPT